MSSIYSSTIPFTYLIGWSKLNKWYYGRKTSKGCTPSDLWTKYYTSSKVVKQFREKYGEPDVIVVRKIFNCTKKCAKWETKVLKRLNAAKNEKYLNQVNGDLNWDTTGVLRTLEQIESVRKKLKGRPLSETHIQNLKKPKTEEHKKNMRKPKPEGFAKKLVGNQNAKGKKSWLGKHHSDETKKKLSEYNKNEPKVVCPYCSKVGKKSSMARWHFDKCKFISYHNL
jgi:hypothetical protein